MPRPPGFIANFDSSTAMVRALGAYLDGRDFPALGEKPLLKIPYARSNLLPERLRRRVYIYFGWKESIRPEAIDQVDAEVLSDWVARMYPDRRYPAVAIGASNGAAVHLYAALGIPWLPQTFLVPVRQRVHPDEPIEAMRVGLEPATRLLERNPDLQLHHMHDANQDRLMIRTMTYFRVKRRRLGDRYRRFLEERLPPGGTILVNECERTWGVTRVGPRHVFQHGAVGGAREREFHEGSPRVAENLRRHGSPYRRWDEPEPDERAPEAEWGFAPELLDDLYEIARQRRYRIVRMRYPEPQALSPLVADLYRWWYRQRNLPANRLLGESFIVLEPWWTLRTGSVPFWMEFNMRPSLEAVHRYLDEVEPFDEIHLMLFNHGARAVGLPDVAEWEGLLRRARMHGGWVGAEPSQFPLDFAQFARYHTEVQKVPARYPLPGPLTLGRFERFLAEHGDRHRVVFETEQPRPAIVG